MLTKQETIDILKFYKDIDNEVAFNSRVLRDYESRYYSISGSGRICNTPKSKYKTSRPTEATALNIPDSLSAAMRELRADIERLGALKAAITQEINKLPVLQKTLIYDFYIRGFHWERISAQVNYSKTQCKNIKNRALDELAKAFSQNNLIAANVPHLPDCV